VAPVPEGQAAAPLVLAVALGTASLGGAGVLAWRRRKASAQLALAGGGHD
jgi:type III secretion protein J